MKKIYNGSELAILVLERDSGAGDEIETVAQALQFLIDHRPDAGLPIVHRLLAEIKAGDPALDPRWQGDPSINPAWRA